MTAPATRRGAGSARSSSRFEALLFLGPGLGFLVVLTAIPTLLIVAYTFAKPGYFGGVEWGFSLDNYARIVEPLYLRIFGQSFVIAFLATVLALLIGYPAAYAMVRLSDRGRLIALVLVLVPFWTNFLIRMYAWIVLLNSQGPVNDTLVGLGITGAPVSMLYTRGAVVVGLAYCYLPLMIVAVYSGLLKIEGELLEAAANLGASSMRTFWSVVVPLSLPGVITGSIFVFVPSLGNFVVPELLGGGKFQMIGNAIRTQFILTRDWPFGATLALVVVVLLIVLFSLQSWVSRRITGEDAR